MNQENLISKLKERFYAVDEAGIHEGDTIGGITVWQIRVFEVIDDVMKRLTLTFYTKDEDAFWGNSEPKPDIPVPDPTFTDRTNAFIATKITDDTIKFGYIVELSEITQKAMISAVMPDNSTKNVIVSEDEEGTFTIEVL